MAIVELKAIDRIFYFQLLPVIILILHPVQICLCHQNLMKGGNGKEEWLLLVEVKKARPDHGLHLGGVDEFSFSLLKQIST